MADQKAHSNINKENICYLVHALSSSHHLGEGKISLTNECAQQQTQLVDPCGSADAEKTISPLRLFSGCNVHRGPPSQHTG